MATRVLTPVCILSYPHIALPKEDDSGKKKYQCALVFDAEAMATPEFAAMKAAMAEAFAAKIPDAQKRAAMIQSPNFKRGIRTDGIDKYEAVGGACFLNARSDTQPGVVYTFPDTANPRPDGTYPPMKMDPKDYAEKLYPGARVRASITAFYFDKAGNRGLAWALNNLQLVGDGTRLDSRVAAHNEFGATDDAPMLTTAANGTALDDLIG